MPQPAVAMLHAAAGVFVMFLANAVATADHPNILLCISDDQSYAHTKANGDPVVKTPAFDRVAREGVRFRHAFCDAPSCGPSRSAILTGQHIWRLKEAGNIHSTLPAEFATYTDMLAQAGYFVGSHGQGVVAGSAGSRRTLGKPSWSVVRRSYTKTSSSRDVE